jgi:phosphopantothenoylcysteine decarboxylase / phosphopantothenate---cysteine ligase
MWNHPATQENIKVLRDRGNIVVTPDEGYLACGMVGPGRLAGQEEIVAAVKAALRAQRDLEGEMVLITAGPTCEDLDPVRYLTNRSSGKMGYAVAEAAARRGAKVILISGPTALDCPAGVERVNVRSAEQMHNAAATHFANSSIAIMAAAVADYRPVVSAENKMKRGKEPIDLKLEPTTDILAALAKEKGSRLVVGFAAETQNVAENARKKLAAKHADVIVANDVTAEGAGFDIDTNIVTIFSVDGRDVALPKLTKAEVALRILDEIVRLLATRKKALDQASGAFMASAKKSSN